MAGSSRALPRRVLAAAAGAVLAAAAVVAPWTVQPAQADVGCEVALSYNWWPLDANGKYIETTDIRKIFFTGFTMTFKVTNRGSTLSPWQVVWVVPPGHLMTPNDVWGFGVVLSTMSTETFKIVNPTFAPALDRDHFVSIGYQGRVPGYYTQPTFVQTLALNNQPCTGLPPQF